MALIQNAGGTAFASRADVSRFEEAGRLVAETTRTFGGLDLLVANHGIWKRAPIEDMTPEQWSETIRTNLDGVYALCHHAARVMIPQRRGSLILVTSTSGQRGEAHYSHYSATKGALLSFTKSLAAELAPHGIRVNAVAPGWVLTDMTRDDPAGPRRQGGIEAHPSRPRRDTRGDRGAHRLPGLRPRELPLRRGVERQRRRGDERLRAAPGQGATDTLRGGRVPGRRAA